LEDTASKTDDCQRLWGWRRRKNGLDRTKAIVKHLIDEQSSRQTDITTGMYRERANFFFGRGKASDLLRDENRRQASSQTKSFVKRRIQSRKIN
jgi:hypothetical protein